MTVAQIRQKLATDPWDDLEPEAKAALAGASEADKRALAALMMEPERLELAKELLRELAAETKRMEIRNRPDNYILPDWVYWLFSDQMIIENMITLCDKLSGSVFNKPVADTKNKGSISANFLKKVLLRISRGLREDYRDWIMATSKEKPLTKPKR